MRDYLKCELCPRRCGVNRSVSVGACGQSDRIRIARVGLHMWEEPPISGERGSGTVFFSGCQLRCVFCQNYEISQLRRGYEITEEKLADQFLRLRDMGAENINLVSPTPFLPSVMNALNSVKPRLGIPIIMNSGGYERVETIKALKGYIDVYLPDLKYFSSETSKKYSGAEDYFECAIHAIEEMYAQVGKPELDRRGMIKKGVIVRHLILPGGRFDSEKAIRALGERFSSDEILLSLMRQYTPMYRAGEFKEINRRVSTFEYNYVLKAAEEYCFDGFTQSLESCGENYVPQFEGDPK